MKKKTNFFIDMDGVLAKWRQAASISEIEQKGYFLNLEVELTLVEVVLEMVRQGYSVSILSHVVGESAASEKTSWLKRCGLGHIHRTFVPYGEPKTDYIKNEDSQKNILLDDYTKNLVKWEEEGNIGVKLYNGVNGNNGTWKGHSVSLEMSFEDIIATLVAIAES